MKSLAAILFTAMVILGTVLLKSVPNDERALLPYGRAECQELSLQVEGAYSLILSEYERHNKAIPFSLTVVEKVVKQKYPLVHDKALENVFVGYLSGRSQREVVTYVTGYCSGVIEAMEELQNQLSK